MSSTPPRYPRRLAPRPSKYVFMYVYNIDTHTHTYLSINVRCICIYIPKYINTIYLSHELHAPSGIHVAPRRALESGHVPHRHNTLLQQNGWRKRIYIYIHIYIYIYVYVYLSIHNYPYIYLYVCMYIHTYTYGQIDITSSQRPPTTKRLA